MNLQKNMSTMDIKLPQKKSSNCCHVHNLITFTSVNCQHHLSLLSHPYASRILSTWFQIAPEECLRCFGATWIVQWYEGSSTFTILSAFHVKLLQKTLCQVLFTWWRCHIIEGFMANKWGYAQWKNIHQTKE